MANIEIAYVSTKEEAEALKKQGYCPVECAFGDATVIDDLMMDHHGKEIRHLESVAIRAYRDFYGVRKDDPRFVINHRDADNMFAIAALAGIIPHPKNPKNSKDLTGLAQTIAIMDTDPIGRNVLDMEGGDVLTIWRNFYDYMDKDSFSAINAVGGWKLVTTCPEMGSFVDVAKQLVLKKKLTSIKEMHTKGRKDGNIFVLSGTTVSGYNEWYGRKMEADPHSVDAWENPVVTTLSAKYDSISIGCPNGEVAEQIFGKGGLDNIFNRLNENEKYKKAGGWGGHVFVGGSPRGMKMTEDDLNEVVKTVNEFILERKRINELDSNQIRLAKIKESPENY